MRSADALALADEAHNKREDCHKGKDVEQNLRNLDGTGGNAVSYTHLDVYKRQGPARCEHHRRQAGSGASFLVTFWRRKK